jgi:hypothetical protein
VDKTLRNNLYQSNSLSYGTSLNATFTQSGNGPSNSESISGLTIPDVGRFNVPSMRPYGFASVAPDNTMQVVIPAGVTSNNPVVLGHVDVMTNKPWTLAKGESAVYSTNVAFKTSSTAAKYYFGNLSATALNGEEINQILADIITYLEDQLSTFQAQMVSIYNSHHHVIPDVGTTGGPIDTIPSPDPFPEDLVTDLQAVETGKTLIDTTTQGA